MSCGIGYSNFRANVVDSFAKLGARIENSGPDYGSIFDGGIQGRLKVVLSCLGNVRQ